MGKGGLYYLSFKIIDPLLEFYVVVVLTQYLAPFIPWLGFPPPPVFCSLLFSRRGIVEFAMAFYPLGISHRKRKCEGSEKVKDTIGK